MNEFDLLAEGMLEWSIETRQSYIFEKLDDCTQERIKLIIKAGDGDPEALEWLASDVLV